MIDALARILALLIAAEVVAELFQAPVPGAALGMVVLALVFDPVLAGAPRL